MRYKRTRWSQGRTASRTGGGSGAAGTPVEAAVRREPDAQVVPGVAAAADHEAARLLDQAVGRNRRAVEGGADDAGAVELERELTRRIDRADRPQTRGGGAHGEGREHGERGGESRRATGRGDEARLAHAHARHIEPEAWRAAAGELFEVAEQLLLACGIHEPAHQRSGGRRHARAGWKLGRPRRERMLCISRTAAAPSGVMRYSRLRRPPRSAVAEPTWERSKP